MFAGKTQARRRRLRVRHQTPDGPKIASPNYYLIEKLVGMKPVREAAEKSGNSTMTASSAGLRALDRYRLQIVFRQSRSTSSCMTFTASAFSAVAREVVEKYRDERYRVREHPVGTMPSSSPPTSGSAPAALC